MNIPTTNDKSIMNIPTTNDKIGINSTAVDTNTIADQTQISNATMQGVKANELINEPLNTIKSTKHYYWYLTAPISITKPSVNCITHGNNIRKYIRSPNLICVK